MRPTFRFSLTLTICLAAGLGALRVGLNARAAPPVPPAPTTRPTTEAAPPSLQGTITAEAEVSLAEMVVYLESPDRGRAMPPPGKAVDVSQKGARFDPPLLVVSVGQTVNFLNDEEDRAIEHNVFSNSPAKRFDLGLYGPNQSRSVTFNKPGAVFLRCSIHRHMDGVVFVAPTPYTSLVDKDGGYAISNVPPGNWILKTWQARRRFVEQSIPVVVEAGKPTTVKLELKRK
jgi:plastocyanin